MKAIDKAIEIQIKKAEKKVIATTKCPSDYGFIVEVPKECKGEDTIRKVCIYQCWNQNIQNKLTCQ